GRPTVWWPGNEMGRPCRNPAHAAVRRADDINDGARFTGSHGISKTIAFLLDQPESKRIGEEGRGSFVSFLRQRGAVKAVNGVLQRTGTGLPALLRTERWLGDDFDPHSIRAR